MNWDAIGSVGEVIGALAVVISIIYLAFQVRQNTNASQGTNELELSKDLAAWHRAPVENENLRNAYNEATAGEDLTVDESTTLIWWIVEWFFLCEGWFQLFNRGLMSEEVWETRAQAALGLFRFNQTQVWWEKVDPPFSKDFKEYINRYRKEGIENWNIVDPRELLASESDAS